jgi:CheY-like chemotaxis protein
MPVNTDSNIKEESEVQRQLAQNYAQDFSIKIEKLKKSYISLSANPVSQEAAAEVELVFQDLMGSGGTFGFHDITDYASLVLRVFQIIKINKMPFNSKVLELIWQSIKYLEIIALQLKRGKVTIDNSNATLIKLKTFDNDFVHYNSDESEKKKILLVDDDPDILRLVEVVLKRSGFTVVTAKNGADALSYLQTDQPSMILLDVAMPGMNGFEVLSQLKTQPNLKSVPIMMLTARSQKEEIIKAIQMGAQNYMVKPFDSKELITRIKKILGD